MEKICFPFKAYSLIKTQGYSESHKANDFILCYDSTKNYGTFLVAPEDVAITKLVDNTNIDTETTEFERGYGILMTSVKNPNITYLYWHCMPIFPVKAGQIVKQGQIVAQMANSGFCMMGGIPVPILGRLVPPYPGTHLHYEFRINGSLTDVFPYLDKSIPITYTWWDIVKASSNILEAIKNLLK